MRSQNMMYLCLYNTEELANKEGKKISLRKKKQKPQKKPTKHTYKKNPKRQQNQTKTLVKHSGRFHRKDSIKVIDFIKKSLYPYL